MTIFISHAAADSEVALGLEKFLERRGQFVELDDGETALRPLQTSDVLLLLVSQHLVTSLYRLRLEQRALDAWADGRLILIKLDHAIAPVGLRDLPTIEASFEARREFVWNDVALEVQKKRDAPLAEAHGEARGEDQGEDHETPLTPDADEPPQATRKRGGVLGFLLTILLISPGAYAITAAVSIWLVNRIGPNPGDLGDVRAGLNALGARYGLREDLGEWLAVGAVALMLVTLLAAVPSLFKRRAPPAPMPTRISNRPSPAPTEAQLDAVFVSYARANSGLVLPVIDAAKRAGRKFWLDQQSTKAGDGWAGDIVRAIRSAPEVLVMCSRAAFESDHVKREIYLADRYKKRLVPVFLEDAQPPEDFEYFFAGVQWLNLFETPEAERPAALMRILETA